MNNSLEFTLFSRGALSAAELVRVLGVSQPTLSRRIAELGSRVVRVGRGRATRYALAREIAPVGAAWPLYRVDEAGRPHRAGVLHALQSRQWFFEAEEPWPVLTAERDFPGGLFPDWPWFLDDLRPQGFLGRMFARAHGRLLGLGADPKEWSADDVTRALVRVGADLPGAWVLGEAALAEAQAVRLEPQAALPEHERAEAYPRLAVATLAGEAPASSAGGEQPKFTTRVGEGRAVIVKFSGDQGRPEDQRWADLLVCEEIASRVLTAGGLPAAPTELVRGGGRVFLESTRFDRVGLWGRRGVISLWAVDGAFFGEPNAPWVAAADRLERAGWLPSADADRLRTLGWFGSLIGNSDMHGGNMSFFLNPERPLALAPVYDMLPMLYRPDPYSGVVEREFRPLPPPPEARRVWRVAAELAGVFWAEVLRSAEISDGFREIALRHRAAVERLQRDQAG